MNPEISPLEVEAKLQRFVDAALDAGYDFVRGTVGGWGDCSHCCIMGCVLRGIDERHGGSYTALAATILGCSEPDARAIEAGYEGFHAASSWLAGSDPEYVAIGKRFADKLKPTDGSLRLELRSNG